MKLKEWNELENLVRAYSLDAKDGISEKKAKKLMDDVEKLKTLYDKYIELANSGLKCGIPYIHEEFGVVLLKNHNVKIPSNKDDEIQLYQAAVITASGAKETVNTNELKPYTAAGQILYKKD